MKMCTTCGKDRKAKLVNGEWELVECDHDMSHLKGIDWDEFKWEQLDLCRASEADAGDLGLSVPEELSPETD